LLHASADFLFLAHATGLTRGNLSVQLTRLEEGGLIEIEKTTRRNRTLTTVALTTGGRRALDSYWQSMEDLRTHAHRVTPKEAKTIEPDPPRQRQRSATR
jgi:DNA-binding MarR family transcriptional regulator